MSKSLEALEVIECILSNHQTMLEAKDKRFEFINIIKQDLEGLEEINRVWHDNEPMEAVDINGKHLQDLYDYNMRLFEENLTLDKKVLELEKENEDLKVFVDAYANARDELLIRNEQLEKENLELKDKLNSEALDNWQLHCKYGKYKKALEILKEKPYVLTIGLENFWWNELEQRYEYIEDIIDEDMYGEATLHIETYELTKEEYELLKEVQK